MSRKNKQAAKGLALTVAAGMVGLGGLAYTQISAGADEMQNGDKVWVCKYVQKPNATELIKSGKNPIEVGWPSAVDGDGIVNVGDEFSDGQELSVVIQINGDDPASRCAPNLEPTPTPTPTPTPDPSDDVSVPPTSDKPSTPAPGDDTTTKTTTQPPAQPDPGDDTDLPSTGADGMGLAGGGILVTLVAAGVAAAIHRRQ
ncbi:hypothetical protein [Aestuariimicrobium ganziense]|uniref:hypothetical protein n=1 Tax=Aestuariimicrobium ganziense TaxID=2773677 RepID=UPI0019428F95|nr:hypothetical protein [Aestuariimicrobium ganziense]